MYRYAGTHWACKLALSLSLLWAHAPNGHTAAWIGAQTPSASRWVQAGIADENGSVFLYVEWNRPKGYGINTFPWQLGKPEGAVLQRRGFMWRAGIDSHWTPWLYFRSPARCSTLELFNGSHGVALIDRRLAVG